MITANPPDPASDIRTPDGRVVRFVLDRSFFHDAFRTDYTENRSAKWFLLYLIYRRALDNNHRICITSSLILDRFSNELQSFGGIPPQTVLALRAIMDVQNLPPDIKEPDDSILIVSKILFDSDRIPVVLSSVKREKWNDRAKRLGIDMGLEEFREKMSEKSIEEHMWFAPFDSDHCVSVLRTYDPFYQNIVRIINSVE